MLSSSSENDPWLSLDTGTILPARSPPESDELPAAMPDLVLLTQMLMPPVAETEAPSQLDDPVDTPLLSEGKCHWNGRCCKFVLFKFAVA